MDPLAESDPRQLGPYKIIARLGSGGMGVVFLGSRGSQRVAVKVMRSSFLDSPTLKTRFEREIATLKKIKSPFVAKYFDSDIEGDLAWHAVEFVNGPTLKEKVENDGPLEDGAWWALYSEIGQALNDVHRVGVVHRDLKPANVILSETGLKLIDFGIAQDSEATSLTSTGMVAGSPAWLSPEQLEGEEVGPGSDLFSAGSILVFAALGRSPWGNERTMSVPVVYQKILTRDLDIQQLPVQMCVAVSCLLEENPGDRRFARSLQESENLPKSAPANGVEKKSKGSFPPITAEDSVPQRFLPREKFFAKAKTKRKTLLALSGFVAAIWVISAIVGLGEQGYFSRESPLVDILRTEARETSSTPPATDEITTVDEERLQECIDALAYVPERISNDIQRKLDFAYTSSLFTGSPAFFLENDPGRNEAEKLKQSYWDVLLQLQATDTDGWHPEAVYSLGVTEQRISDAISKLNYFQNNKTQVGIDEFESAFREIRRVEALPPEYNIEQSVRNGDGYCGVVE